MSDWSAAFTKDGGGAIHAQAYYVGSVEEEFVGRKHGRLPYQFRAIGPIYQDVTRTKSKLVDECLVYLHESCWRGLEAAILNGVHSEHGITAFVIVRPHG